MILIIISTILFAVALFFSLSFIWRVFAHSDLAIDDDNDSIRIEYHVIALCVTWAVFYFITQFLNYA